MQRFFAFIFFINISFLLYFQLLPSFIFSFACALIQQGITLRRFADALSIFASVDWIYVASTAWGQWIRNELSFSHSVIVKFKICETKLLRVFIVCNIMLSVCYVRWYHIILCYVMICYVMLCYFMLCYVMLCYVM